MAFFDDMFDMGDSMAGIPVIEGSQYYMDNGGVATIISEAHEDHLEVIKAIHAADMAELKATTEGYDYYDYEQVQEASGENIFTKIKNAIKNFFGKIGAFFKNIIEKVTVYNKSNKAFADKYVDKIKDINGSPTVTVQGFNYDNIDEIIGMAAHVAENSDKVATMYSNTVDKFISKADDSLTHVKDEDFQPAEFKRLGSSKEVIAKYLLGGKASTKISSDANMAGIAYAAFRNGETTRHDVSYSKDQLIKNLESISSLDIKALNKAHSATAKSFGKVIKTVESAEKKYNKLSSDNKAKASLVNASNTLSKNVIAAKSATLTIISAIITASTELSNQIKSATTKMLAEAKKSDKN